MILFQPCPFHFPDLWKAPQLTLPEITPKQLQAVRELYQFPDDDSEDAQLYFVPPSVLAQAYASLRFQDAHGYLVENGRLVIVGDHLWAIESMNALRRAEEVGDPHVKLSHECYRRAEAFELPQETPRRGFPGGLGHAQMRRDLCHPCARQTWPPTE